MTGGACLLLLPTVPYGIRRLLKILCHRVQLMWGNCHDDNSPWRRRPSGVPGCRGASNPCVFG